MDEPGLYEYLRSNARAYGATNAIDADEQMLAAVLEVHSLSTSLLAATPCVTAPRPLNHYSSRNVAAPSSTANAFPAALSGAATIALAATRSLRGEAIGL